MKDILWICFIFLKRKKKKKNWSPDSTSFLTKLEHILMYCPTHLLISVTINNLHFNESTNTTTIDAQPCFQRSTRVEPMQRVIITKLDTTVVEYWWQIFLDRSNWDSTHRKNAWVHPNFTVKDNWYSIDIGSVSFYQTRL